MDDRYNRTVQQLKEAIAWHEDRLARLRRALRELVPVRGSIPEQGLVSSFASGRFERVPQREALRTLLRESSQPRSARELAEELVANGYGRGAKTVEQVLPSVASVLSANPEFRYVPDQKGYVLDLGNSE